jgi:hypothetical protein
MSVDTDATVGEKDINVIESVQDGNKKLFKDEPSSATKSTKETTVSHLNQSRQNIGVDGKLYRCNKVRVIGEKNKVVYTEYLQCEMALDKSDGSKWKLYNEVKATLSSKKNKCNYTRCYGTLRAKFSEVCGKVLNQPLLPY